MGWIEKGQPTPFDEQPIEGLFFLDGDALARLYQRDWTSGQKYPMIAFPSGEECTLWESSNPDAGGIVHVFGEMDLPLRDTRDEALQRARHVAEYCGYFAQPVDEDGLEVQGHDTDEHFVIRYDDQARLMRDLEPVRDAPPREIPRMELLPDEIREQLPALYSNEEIGLDAVAPVKWFTPDSSWSWFPTEFDGEDLLFGLAVGFEAELGYFSLAELEAARGPFGLPIERDLYYQPRSLRELLEEHQQRHRGE